MNLRILLYAIIGGVIITLLTGLIPNTSPELLGALHYGYPFPWFIRIVYPQFPWHINEINLINDIAFWSVTATIVLLVLKRVRKISAR